MAGPAALEDPDRAERSGQQFPGAAEQQEEIGVGSAGGQELASDQAGAKNYPQHHQCRARAQPPQAQQQQGEEDVILLLDRQRPGV